MAEIDPPAKVATSAELGPVPRWWRCDTHGPGNRAAWGCPECVREMRQEIAGLHVLLKQQQASYEREIEIEVAAERARCYRAVEDNVRAVDAADALAAIRGA